MTTPSRQNVEFIEFLINQYITRTEINPPVVNDEPARLTAEQQLIAFARENTERGDALPMCLFEFILKRPNRTTSTAPNRLRDLIIYHEVMELRKTGKTDDVCWIEIGEKHFMSDSNVKRTFYKAVRRLKLGYRTKLISLLKQIIQQKST